MIQIDMDKPKNCIWADITNHIYHCPLLNMYHKCNLQDSEPRTIKEQYERCPLHEVTADPDTASRPKGHWVKHHESSVGIVYCCDRCGRTLQALSWETRKDVCKMYPFCHCGADMRGIEYE